MVFRGKPSKACQRCRTRKLKCDLNRGGCGQCVRASQRCSGYRDTQQLQIHNESQAVVRKALIKASVFEPRSLPLSVDLQARGVFFAYYVTGNCWAFLGRYCHPTDSPHHLTLAIEAVSLAYLWHQVYSDAALVTARERYISALRTTNKTLTSSKEATKVTTVMATLLLDLFQKITDSKPRNNKSWTSHLNGALALVRLRGLQQFQDRSELSVLIRLSSHYLISCIASGSPVSGELIVLRDYIGKSSYIQRPMSRLTDLMVQFANLHSEIRRGILSDHEYIEACVELDIQLQAVDLDMPPSWQYTTTLLDHMSDRTLDLHYDTYPHRNICIARNFLRIVRIFLNESVIDYHFTSPTSDKYLALRVAHDNIETLVSEIGACVPQYVDCHGAARQRLPKAEESVLPDQTPDHMLDGGRGHSHTPEHQTDCYTLIFPLYIAGRSKGVPHVRPWAIEELHYISSHFNVRNAEVVAQMLKCGADVGPWEVYAMLGSYAFLV